MRTSDNRQDRKGTRPLRHPVPGLPPAEAGAVGAAATAGGTCQQMGTRSPGPQRPGGKGPPLPDGPHDGPASPEHGLCPLRNAEDEASAAEHRPLARVWASRAAVLPRPTPCSLTGSGCPSGLPVGAAHRPGVSTPRGDQVPALRRLCGRQLPPGPARAEASEAQPADGPSPGVLTGRGAAAPPELGLIHGRGRPSRGKQRVASGGLGGEEPPLISA